MKPLDSNEEELLKVLNANKKILSYMSLAAKAGKIVSGELSVEKAVKQGKAHLVIVAEEASYNTRKMFSNMCTYYNTSIYFFGRKEDIGHAIGKNYRASIAFLDRGLADATCKQLKIATKSGGNKNVKNENISICKADRKTC